LPWGLNSIERSFNRGELALEGTILLQPEAETANDDGNGSALARSREA
jgi:hypothetical protein